MLDDTHRELGSGPYTADLVNEFTNPKYGPLLLLFSNVPRGAQNFVSLQTAVL